MLKIKELTFSGGLVFNYASIQIGPPKSSRMEMINNELKGTSTFVLSAAQVSSRFREILNTKAK